MSNIKPFKAVHYNLEKVEDLAQVVCPPYDVISDEQQDDLHNKSPYNFTHIDLGKDQPGDNDQSNKYIRAKEIFSNWLKEGVMVQDDKEGLYFYRQEYKIQGQKHSRTGFICLMKLHDEENSKVHPHEKTHAAACDDRLSLYCSLDSALSSIFVCYSDTHRKIEKIFNKNILTSQPMFEVNDDDNVKHTMWRLDDPDLISVINDSMADQNLFIADGHHRYKVATDYRKAQIAKTGELSEDAPYNYVMTYFTNIDSKDLQIFPMHRIVKKVPENLDFLEKFFRIDKIKNKEELLILLAKAGRNEHAFGMYAPDGIKLLRLKNKTLIEEFVKEGSDEYKSLDATILKSFVFDQIDVQSKDIIYTKDLGVVTDMVDNGEAAAGFVMNPVKISQLKAIALNGERMPPKTTYFYPKVLSGLTVYKLD